MSLQFVDVAENSLILRLIFLQPITYAIDSLHYDIKKALK